MAQVNASSATPASPAEQRTAHDVFTGLLSIEDPEPEEAEETAEGEEPSEGEAADDSAEAEPDAEEDTKPEEDGEPERTHRIKIDGEWHEVPESEVLKGYSRTADYTRKTQALAEKERALEPERTAVRTERQQLAANLQELQSAMQSLMPQEPDWNALRAQDPIEFAATYAEWNRRQQQIAQVAQLRQQAEQKVLADLAAQREQMLVAESEKLLAAVPEWKDAKVAEKEKTAMWDFAKRAGYSEEELGQVVDHRVVALLRKAYLYDRSQKLRPQMKNTITAVTKPAAPNAVTPPKPGTSRKNALARLQKSGSVKDAASVFETMLD